MPAMGLLIGGLAALAISLSIAPVYTTHIQLFVSTTDSTSTSAVFQGSQFSQQRVASYATHVSGEEVSDRVIRDLGLNMTAEDLGRRITASVVPDTVLLDVTVKDSSAGRAKAI